jgi:hypothetical protein
VHNKNIKPSLFPLARMLSPSGIFLKKGEAEAWVGILQKQSPKADEWRHTPTHAGA